MNDDGLMHDPEGTARCAWAGGRDDYRAYHDTEWGHPQGGRRALFEKLCLEGFQAGLSWITILRKRTAFRELFENFEPARLVRFGESDVARIVADERIVRHRAKILSAINNAHRIEALQQGEGRSFEAFVWSFEPGPRERPALVDRAFVAANPVTPASTALSKALKRHGFSFVGPTTVHAFMQAMGLVNDHVEGCACRAPCEAERAAFVRPKS